MTVQDKFYILADGYALDSNLNETTQDGQIAFYSSEAEIDTALSGSGVVGKMYTIRHHKEVTQ